MSRRAFTLVEVLVVIAIIGILLGLVLPMVEKTRHKAYIAKCAVNLRVIGQAISMYANAERGWYPRSRASDTAKPTAGTGFASTDAFSVPTFVAPNDVSAAIYLLARTQRLPPAVLICPYNDETTYTADTADFSRHANFSDFRHNLAYSYANPYPDANAQVVGYRLTNKLPPGFAVMADLNPGVTARSDPTAVVPGAGRAVRTRGNSLNHEQDGQNILYADGHVDFANTCLAGLNRDNIYTNAEGKIEASPLQAGDSVLLPDGDD